MALPTVAVLFDFDGTLGDTETPAMEVAYWEIVPYLVGPQAADLEGPKKMAFIQDNAGRAFEQMIKNADEDRAAAGLQGAEAAHEAGVEVPAEHVVVIDAARKRFGLPPFWEARKRFPTLLQMQKIETVEALSVTARANPGVMETLEALRAGGQPFSIATTSPKPRVPVCVDTAGLRPFFPADKIFSGESDFDPPRFKPDPAVYLLAVSDSGLGACHCIAVEDSASGVGSAANAEVGLIVGYVGATHIPAEKKEPHARELMQGTKSLTGRGAELVVMDMPDLLVAVHCYRQHLKDLTPKPTFTGFKGTVYFP